MNAARLVAAVAVSAGLHVGAAFVGWSPRPIDLHQGSAHADFTAATVARPAPLRVRVAASGGSGKPTASAPVVEAPQVDALRPGAAVALVLPSPVTLRHSPPARSSGGPVEHPIDVAYDAADEPTVDASVERRVDESDAHAMRAASVASPRPLSYPVFVLPPDDDPRRIGLTRLLLVVSSRGETVDVIVTASTMSQDYVDRVVQAFQTMRFDPARVRGLPYPGTYDVVVNFTYEPSGSRAL